ncbi:MAG: uroporphyrinogen decarboxylase family protein, partial [Candidatus Hodarchaeota archaeon]
FCKMLSPKDRFLAVFSDERNKLDRVPTHVQGIRHEFTQLYEEELFDTYEGELTYTVSFDPPLILGFDAVFADMPSSVTCKPIKFIDEKGVEHQVNMDGQATNTESSYYSGGLIDNMELLEKILDNVKILDASKGIQEMVKYQESISNKIFPTPTLDGIFDKAWRAMGFPKFARNHRKNTTLYKEIIKMYAFNVKTNVEKIIEATGDRCRIIIIKDDFAFKGRPMISPERWMQDIGKYYKDITKMIKDAGMYVVNHTDGDVTELVPKLIEAGFQGVQGWEGGCDPYVIADKFPDFVVIGFGDVGDVLPFGTDEEIKEHVKFLMDALKEGRHYVFGPSTVIFGKHPIKNIRLFIKYGKELGKY